MSRNLLCHPDVQVKILSIPKHSALEFSGWNRQLEIHFFGWWCWMPQFNGFLLWHKNSTFITVEDKDSQEQWLLDWIYASQSQLLLPIVSTVYNSLSVLQQFLLWNKVLMYQKSNNVFFMEDTQWGLKVHAY